MYRELDESENYNSINIRTHNKLSHSDNEIVVREIFYLRLWPIFKLSLMHIQIFSEFNKYLYLGRKAFIFRQKVYRLLINHFF